jgi:hypothetical protein
VAVLVHFIWLIALVVGMLAAAAGVVRVLVDVTQRHDAAVAREAKRLAGARARVDQQHACVMQGDERGTYRDFLPAAT